MRILYITRANLSFSRAHTQNILKTSAALRARGHAVDIINQRRSLPLFFAAYKKRKEFDVLYFRDPYLWWVAFFTRIFFGKKIIFEVHGSREWRFGAPFWHAALLVSTSAVFITKKLAEYYHYRKPFVITHASGVELAAFTIVPEVVHATRTALVSRDDVPVLVYAGSFLWYDVGALLEVVCNLKVPAHLVIVGAKTEEEQIIRARAKSLGIQDRVHVVGRIKPAALPPYLLMADILLNPLTVTYPSSISSKLYEYLAAGKPIISSKGGANDEIIEDGRNGVLLQQASPRLLAEAAEKLLHDPTRARFLADNAKADAERYTWDARAKAIEALL